MKKKVIILLIGLFIVTIVGAGLAYASAYPCTTMWKACADKNGYDDRGCDMLFDMCLYVMYPLAR